MSDASTVEHTDCCIVGAGPAGAVLAVLLPRQGIGVTLLEAHADSSAIFEETICSQRCLS